jgi:hypothetical protein
MRHACSLLALLALLLGQVGAQLDGVAHLRHDLGVVHHGEKKAPPLGHSVDVCAGYSVICGSAIGHVNLWQLLPAGLPGAVPILFRFFQPRAPRIQFLPRAPPGFPRP